MLLYGVAFGQQFWPTLVRVVRRDCGNSVSRSPTPSANTGRRRITSLGQAPRIRLKRHRALNRSIRNTTDKKGRSDEALRPENLIVGGSNRQGLYG